MNTRAALLSCLLISGCAGSPPDPIPPADSGDQDVSADVGACTTCSECLLADAEVHDCSLACRGCVRNGCTPCQPCLGGIGVCSVEGACIVNGNGCYVR